MDDVSIPFYVIKFDLFHQLLLLILILIMQVHK